MLPIIAFAAALAALPACAADQLSLGFDAENGAFNGMSHGGALLVIRNVGTRPCRLAALPRLTFNDGAGKPLPIVRRAPPGMHPGPAVPPVGIAAGAEVTAPLRWVSGEVYDKSRCLTPASAAVAIGSGTTQTAFSARICGPAGSDATFDQPPLKPDPVLR
ncbi:DUF4232 domain-containing protein [Sphingomonas profundi]|uniref:DUF4232 domain-containing protein n=1 Tax=Alterirhizorhabdus profundi TaxID=2681549 RepID=UPI0012E8352F|nr:DUF4232 domain-containing protein [Sphingomonas profundi]